MRHIAGVTLSAILVLTFVVSLPAACSYSATLRVGALRTLDALPLSLANYKPIFEENHLAVEAKYFETPAEMRAALANGEIDAAIMDLPGALLLKEVKIVRVAMTAWSGRTFAVMVAPHISATSIETLHNAGIAICSEASHRYIADKLLASAGVNNWTEVATSDPDTTLRMLLDGKVIAALLPEPQVSMAIAHGAHIILDDADPEFCPDCSGLPPADSE